MDIQNQQQYKFFYGTKSQFDRLKGLGIVNPNNLYYITDKQQIYVGEDCYSSEFLIVDEFPIEPKINTIYIHKDTKEVKIFDGIEFNTVCLPVLDNLNVDYSIATSKAIKEYIKNISDTNITNIKYNKTSQSFDVYYGDSETETILLKDIITGVEYDATNGNFKFSQANGEDILINTPKENFLADVTYDPYKNAIKFVMVNGSTFEVDLTDLIEIYTTENTSTINMNISDNKIFANVKLSENEGNRAIVDDSGLYIPDTDLSNYSTSTETNDLIINITDPIQREVDRLEIDKQNNLTPGKGIRIDNNVISSVLQSVEWGNIQGDILKQEDLQKQFTELQTNIETNISNTESELQDNIDKLEQQTNENINELNTNLNKNIQQVQTNLNTVETNLGKDIQQVQTNLNNTETSLTKDIQQVQTNLNTVETDLTKDIQQVQINLNTVENNLSGDITDLSNELSATEQEIQTELDTKVNLNDMVEIEMVEVDIDGIKSDIQNLENTKQNNLTSANAGDGISIVNGVISSTGANVEWGKIQGNILSQTDLSDNYQGIYTATIDLTDTTKYLDTTWYPVVGESLLIKRKNISRPVLTRLTGNFNLGGVKPSWSTHQSGYTCVLDLLDVGFMWGGTPRVSHVLQDSTAFTTDNTKPPIRYSQMTNSSRPVFWLRGGGKYYLTTEYDAKWSIKTEPYTASEQTVTPTTTCPALSLGAQIYAKSVNSTSKGNSTTPIYFDANGVAQTITSYSGNANTATSATKATADASGNVITSTYRKISDSYTKTETDTKIANSTGTGDGKSITKTSDNKLQAVGVLDARNTSTALKTWTGTRAQYDAIATKDDNTLYHITDDTDDTDVTLSLLETLYPVGAIYIGTMATCPLQVLGVGTWALKATDRVLQGAGVNSVGSTVEAGLPNIEVKLGGLFNGSGYVIPTKTSGVRFEVESGVNGVSQYSTGNYNNTIIDASLSNPIYGKNGTVQAPAYIVNIWERIS